MKRTLVISICAFVLMLTPTISSAALVPCDGALGNVCKTCHLMELGSNIIEFLITVMVSVVALVFIAGGFKMVTSGGDHGAVSDAKHMMTNAVIGFVILLLAWLIVDTFLKVFLRTEGDLKLGPWNQIECENAPVFTGGGGMGNNGGNGNNNGGGGGNTTGGGVVGAGAVGVRDASGNIQQVNFARTQSDNSLNSNFTKINGDYGSEIATACQSSGSSISNCTNVMTALIAAESGGRPDAVSNAGAVGIMQLLPENGGRTCGANDSGCITDQIRKGVSHLNSLYSNSAVGGNTPNALAGYNGGASTVDGGSASGKRPALAPSQDCPGLLAYQCGTNPGGLIETQHYVANICQTLKLQGSGC